MRRLSEQSLIHVRGPLAVENVRYLLVPTCQDGLFQPFRDKIGSREIVDLGHDDADGAIPVIAVIPAIADIKRLIENLIVVIRFDIELENNPKPGPVHCFPDGLTKALESLDEKIPSLFPIFPEPVEYDQPGKLSLQLFRERGFSAPAFPQNENDVGLG